MQCPGCQRQIPAGSRFCGGCGTRLGGGVAATTARPELGETTPGEVALPLQDEGERRHLTVLFCDLVDSTVLAGKLDPEDWAEILRTYQRTCVRAIESFQGLVVQYLGDGILAYFSYPHAHEDDAERAVRAGLGILSGIREVKPRLEPQHDVRLAARIGIHTGDVVIGGMGSGEHREILALGQAPNLAARLQAIAEPDSVVMSGGTARLVRGLFITRDLGTQSLAGIADPVPTYQVVQGSGVRSRLDAAAAGGLTPLVGREPDLATLLGCWRRASAGRGEVVLVGGDAGIGKSRLVYALRERLSEQPHTWLECRGSPFHGNSALHPVIELLRQGLRITPGESPDEQVAKIEEGLGRARLALGEAVPLFTALLSLPIPRRYAALEISPEGQRRKTLEALVNWLLALANLQPAVLVIEDLHWADPTSLELLGMLLARTETAPLLLVATFRPWFEPPWPTSSWLTRTTVGPLSRAETAAMVRRIAGDAPLSAPVLGQIVEKTDGVPLFVEELTKSVLESAPIAQGRDGYGLQPRLSIPSSLQDSLAARLDRLGRARQVAQLAAVVGREFSYELLEAVSGVAAPLLDERLAQLTAAELVFQSGERPLAYTFKHALIQEAAYHSLLRSTRRALHARIARVLERRFPERVQSEPEEIARHCEGGGLIERAISYHRRAAELATMRSANSEAVGHLTRSIELLRTLPEGIARNERELDLLDLLGPPLVAATGWGSDEAERAYGRARELCELIGEVPQLFFVIRGLVTYYLARSELETARELCTRLVRLSERDAETSKRLAAHEHMAILLYFQGDQAAALGHFERAFALYDPILHGSLAYLYGNELGVFVRCFFSWNLWLLGYPDRAQDTSREAVDIGAKASHPFSHAYALLWSSVVHVMRREPEQARELAAAAVAIAEEQGFAFVRGGARLIHGWACFDPGAGDEEVDRAFEEFRAGLAQVAKVGTRVCVPQIFGVFSAAQLEAGRQHEAHGALRAAFAASESTHQSFWDAELYRIKGLLLQQEGQGPGPMESAFRQALDVARRQGARSLELRAATSLSRLWQQQGERERARDLLAPIYAWFTEGFDTADLREARELLDELS